MQIPAYVQFVLDALNQSGFDAYIVGGSVRDALRGQQPDDFDVTTNALPKEIIQVFDGKCKVILTGLKHGTVTVLSDKMPIEVTTYRTDGDYKDNRHPESVTFIGKIDGDLARRDFTVNAMAYAPSKGLVDLFGGQADLQSQILRCVGTPDIRFHEDALRMLRALRFASVLQFEIEPETEKSIRQNRALLKNVSAERIRTELFKLLCGADAKKVLLAYKDIFFTLFPALEDGYTNESYTEAISYMSTLPKDACVRFAALLMPAVPYLEACYTATDSLKTDRKSADAIKFAISHINERVGSDKISIRRALSRYGEAHLRFLLTLQNATNALSTLDTVLTNGDVYSIRDLAIRGEDIAALGYTGKQIGEVLSQLLDMVMEESLENRKEKLVKAIERIK